MKTLFLVIICVAGLQSCFVLNNDIGRDNYLTRIQSSSKCHQPQRKIPMSVRSTASLPGGGSALGLSDPSDHAFFRDAKPDYFWFPPR